VELAVLDGSGAGSIGKLELKEQVIKVIQRRAATFEGMERWDRARSDWEKLAGVVWRMERLEKTQSGVPGGAGRW